MGQYILLIRHLFTFSWKMTSDFTYFSKFYHRNKLCDVSNDFF